MKRYWAVWAVFLLCGAFSLSAQNIRVQHLWGKAIGKAQNDRDFLIYDATCPQSDPSLFIVGKAENSNLENKDENTDAFLSCMSLNGELLWRTYLPAEDGYYNAFATTVEYTQDSTILVIGNAYQIQDNLEKTKALIPRCPGKLFFFEFDMDGQLRRSKTVSFSWRQGSNPGTILHTYPPRVTKITEQTNHNTYTLGGFVLSGYSEPPTIPFRCFVHSSDFTTSFSWQSDNIDYTFPIISDFDVFYSATYPLTVSYFANIVRQTKPGQSSLALGCKYVSNPRGSERTTHNSLFYSRGIDLLQRSPLGEKWNIRNPSENPGPNNGNASNRYIGDPIETLFYSEEENSSQPIFPGTVQNIRTYNDKYIVQGIHCKDYSNGFFKSADGRDYAYSHDNTHPIPMPAEGFYQSRNNSSTAVPYLLIYDSATLFSEPEFPTPQETEAAYDFEAPLWGSYLDADWLYEDIFHLADSAQWKDIYQPYEPVLCSYNNKFFLIGNAKSIDYDLIGNPVMTEEVFHHQGVVLAFASSFEGDCPIEQNTAFEEDGRFLCPGDSVELHVPSDYIGFKFCFDSAYLADNSIVLNADSSRAWAKKEGSFTATLDGSAFGCPDVSVDTVRIYLHLLPSMRENVFLPDDTTLCAHLDLELNLSDTADDYRCFWLDRDSVALPYGYDTARYTVQGLRGLDGYGAGTDTREPRFFQLRLDHKLCGVSFFDTLLVYDQVKPVFELLCHDTLICLDEPVEMDSLSPHVYRPFYVFEWNDGTKGSGYVFTDSGVYVLQFFVGKNFAVCGYDTASDTIRVRWSDPAQTRITLSDTSFCEKLSVTLDASVPFDSTRYSWQEGPLPDPEEDFEEDTIIFTSPVIKVDREMTLSLFLVDTMGCINAKQIEVKEDDCSPKLEIPNVFTPNGDGVNDVWKFKQLEWCVDVMVEVVDRWGQPVLKTKVATADDFEWNGTVNNKGRRLPDGPYFYMVTYKDVYGKSKVQSGSITILGTAE